MRRAVGLTLLFLLVVGSGACSSPATTRPNALVIGAIYPLTGSQSPGGSEELLGVQAALAVARTRGVPRAGDIDLHIVDARTPEAARAAVDRLIDKDHARVIIGTYGSTLAAAAAARADERHTIYWETGAVADEVTLQRHYVFRTVATGSTLGRMAATFTAGVLVPAGPVPAASARIVILHTADIYGASVAAGEAEEARGLGFPPPIDIAYDPHAFDPVQVADQVLSQRPDYLWDVSYIDDGVALWREIHSRHPHLLGAVGTSSAFCMPDFERRLGADAIGVFAADKPDEVVSSAALSPAGRSLLEAATASYTALGGRRPMSIPAVAGFVGGWTLFHDVLAGFRSAPSVDQIRDAANAVDVPAGDEINGGGVKFAAPGQPDAGQNRRAVSVVGQWQAGGAMKVVYPSSFANGTAVLPPVPVSPS